MNRARWNFINSFTAPDDKPLSVVVSDLSGGVNTRLPADSIGDKQATALLNVSLDVAGEVTKRPGSVLIGNDVSNNGFVALHNYPIQGETDQLLGVEGANLRKWTGAGNWSSAIKSDFTAAQTDYGFVNCRQSGVTPDQVVIVQNGFDNPFLVDAAGTVTDLLADHYYSLPKTTVMGWHNNRVWALKNDMLYFSEAYPAQYQPDSAAITGDMSTFTGVSGDKIKVIIDSTTYDDIDISACTDIDGVVAAINAVTGGTEASKTAGGYLKITSTDYGLASITTIADGTNTEQTVVGDLFTVAADRTDTGKAPFALSDAFRVPVGEERGLASTRDMGIVVMGKEAIWCLNPSATPTASDKPEPLIPNMGVVSKKAWACVGDDIYFFSQDGLRAVKRTQQDKLQLGATYPVSYRLKTEFSRISWAYASRIALVYFDNKLFISVPTSSTAYDTWVYYPALDAFVIIQGYSPRCWSTYKVSNEERLYYGIEGDGKVYRAWYGYTDQGSTTTDGTAINLQEEGKEENFGYPLIKKSGGEVKIEAKKTGDYTISVYVSLDGDEYAKLGDMDIDQTYITFPTTFPASFPLLNRITETFHLDEYGEFKTLKLKIVHNDTNSTDITIYKRNVITFPCEYESEE